MTRRRVIPCRGNQLFMAYIECYGYRRLGGIQGAGMPTFVYYRSHTYMAEKVEISQT